MYGDDGQRQDWEDNRCLPLETVGLPWPQQRWYDFKLFRPFPPSEVTRNMGKLEAVQQDLVLELAVIPHVEEDPRNIYQAKDRTNFLLCLGEKDQEEQTIILICLFSLLPGPQVLVRQLITWR